MKRLFLGVLATTLLITSNTLALTVKADGKPIGTTISQNGKTYVSLDSLKAAGIPFTVQGSDLILGTAGGQNQIPALSGCLGETLFNGVWRLKVLAVRPATLRNKPGWEIDLEIRNATSQPLNLYGSGFSTPTGGLTLKAATSDNTTMTVWRGLDQFKKVIPGGPYAFTAQFLPDEAHANEPLTKLLLTRDNTAEGAKLPFTTKNPSFRVDLTCQK